MRLIRLLRVGCVLVLLLQCSALPAKPDPNDRTTKKDQPGAKKASAFKPIEIQNELTANDPNDPQINEPSKKYPVKLVKGRTYIIDLMSKDFDAYLRLLDKNGNEVAEDDDGGGDLNARIIFSPTSSALHEIVAITLDGQLGKFTLKVRELNLKGEAKPRVLGKDGLNVTNKIGAKDASAVGKLGKLFSVQLEAGHTYTINLASQDFDSYLYLFDTKAGLLAQDDDSGGGANGLDSRITFRATSDGVYHILATSLDGTQTGDFTLKLTVE